MVHLKGLEPSRRGHQILSLARLPSPPQVHLLNKESGALIFNTVNSQAPREVFINRKNPERFCIRDFW